VVGRRISHYPIEERLGAGGMGEVFLARDLALGRMAALKLLPPDFTPAIRTRLLKEASSSSRLQHPSIATFYESGEENGNAFIAMEYVRGRTLRHRLGAGAVPVAEAVSMAVSVLEALAHAHAGGILHRDVKPENIMLVERGPAKLLDFGIAKHLVRDPGGERATRTASTRAGYLLGTPGYMAPEQLLGDEIDGRADLFALGAVLFEAVVGKSAFRGDTAAERIASVLAPTPVELSDASVPDGLRAVLKRALAKDRQSRFPTAASFLGELGAAGGGSAAAATTGTLAVFDFENLSGDAADNWVGSGVAESIAAELMRLPGLTVLPREKIQKARGAHVAAGRDAGVLDLCQTVGCRWAVSGSFQKMGGAVRFTSRIHEVATGRTLASEKLDGTLEGIFAMQDRLAEGVARSLNREIPEAGRTRGASDVRGYECYARGRRLFQRLEKGSFDQARALYEEAMRLDPRFAGPPAGLSAVHAMRFTFTTDPEELDLAAGYARRAIELDPLLSEPHIWLSYAYIRQDRLEEGYAEAMKANELDGTNPYATYFAAAAKLAAHQREEALSLYQRTVEIDPQHGFGWLGVGWTHLELDRKADSTWCLERACELEREDAQGRMGPTAGVSGYLGECLRRCGDLGSARERCIAGIEAAEKSDHMFRDSFRGVGLCALGRTALDQGDLEAARAAFGQAVAHLRGRPRALGGGYLLVQALAGLSRAGAGAGHLDEALDRFRKREGANFSWLWMCTEDISLLELSRAARAVGRDREADELHRAALEAGSVEAAALAT